MNNWGQQIIIFISIILIQGLVLNNMQINVYSYPMIYIMLILMLPFEINFLLTVVIALGIGIMLDTLSDTFGLHTSSAVLIAYVRPIILKTLKPRDGYEKTLKPTVHDMGYMWFGTYTIISVLIHHLWFFGIELYRFDLIGVILLKTIISGMLSALLIFLFQYLFYKPSK